MKCSNCGFVNKEEAKFCGSCGIKLEQRRHKNNKKKIFVSIILIFILIFVLTFIFNFNKESIFDDPFQDVDKLLMNNGFQYSDKKLEINSLVNSLEEDYNSGKITADEYIMQLAYSVYEIDKLDDKYKNLDFGVVDYNTIYEKADELIDNISSDTIKYLLEKYFLLDVMIEDSADNNQVENQDNNISNYEVTPVVSKEGNLQTLNEALLSENGNFIIYYTTDGDNAITKDVAEKTAYELENIVEMYKEKYGLDFIYKPDDDFLESLFTPIPDTIRPFALLRKNGIDPKYIETAMPVYILDLSDAGVAGYYTGPIEFWVKAYGKFSDLWEDYEIRIENMLTAYSFPYFAVNSSPDDLDELKITLAHELFHHYQKYICGDGEYKTCLADNFTVETTADFVVTDNLNIDRIGTLLNGHAWKMYINEVSSSIDKVGEEGYGEAGTGYGAFVFAKNYSDVTENGADIWISSIKYENPLSYIYNQSNENYKKAFLLMAERNLTLDYDSKIYLASDTEKIYFPSNYKNLGTTNNIYNMNIDYSSIQYFYVNPSSYNPKSQIVFSGENDNLSLLLFVRDNEEYKYLYTHTLTNDFVININEFNGYGQVVFAVVNSEITDSISYKIEVLEDGNKLPTVTISSLGLLTIDDMIENKTSFMCYQINEDEEWYNIYQVKVGFNDLEELNEMYYKGIYKFKNYDEDSAIFNASKKIMSGFLFIMKQTYKQQLKYVDIMTKEGTDEYSVTFKVKKNYYDAFLGSFSASNNKKKDIIEAIQKQGFICIYE